MKDKRSLWILLPVFVIVWSFVGYKIYTTFFQSNKVVLSTLGRDRNVMVEKTVHYRPVAKYRDPFLGTAPKQKVTENQTVVSPNSKPRIAEPQLPEISYIGFIGGSGKMGQALLKIQNNVFLSDFGDTVSGFVVQSIAVDSVLLLYNNKTVSVRIFETLRGLSPVNQEQNENIDGGFEETDGY